MSNEHQGIVAQWDDVWLLGGVRTPFADYNGALSAASPIDMGIKVTREALARTGIAPSEVGTIVVGNMAQASFDAYFTARHMGLYSGVPISVPALQVQRICGSGIEAVCQVADAISLGRVNVGVAAGTESMSRNPVAAYTHRAGFRMGQVEFKDFLWEALMDTSCDHSMGDTAEKIAARLGITRQEVDRFAAQSFDRALRARVQGFFDAEILSIANERFELDGFRTRELRLRGVSVLDADAHVRPSSLEELARIRPAFGGVQTGGNSSGVVDGAAAVLVVSGEHLRSSGGKPMARIVAGCSVGCLPQEMGLGPTPAINALLAATGVPLDAIGRFEINEAFGAQILGVIRTLDLDEAKVNVNGGAIAIGHPLGATGVRLTLTVAREMQRSDVRYGIASACIGGGQGIALLLENPGGV